MCTKTIALLSFGFNLHFKWLLNNVGGGPRSDYSFAHLLFNHPNVGYKLLVQWHVFLHWKYTILYGIALYCKCIIGHSNSLSSHITLHDSGTTIEPEQTTTVQAQRHYHGDISDGRCVFHCLCATQRRMDCVPQTTVRLPAGT